VEHDPPGILAAHGRSHPGGWSGCNKTEKETRPTNTMNLEKIAAEAANRIEPSLYRNIEAAASSTDPEIVIGREAMERKIKRITSIVSDAIAQAIRKESDAASALAMAACDVVAHPCESAFSDLKDALDAWRNRARSDAEDANHDS
jgi:hypothetical protein